MVLKDVKCMYIFLPFDWLFLAIDIQCIEMMYSCCIILLLIKIFEYSNLYIVCQSVLGRGVLNVSLISQRKFLAFQ